MKKLIKGLILFAFSFALFAHADAPTYDKNSTSSTLYNSSLDDYKLTRHEICAIGVKECIKFFFPEEPELAIAVFTAESGLKASAIGYNCRYGTKVASCKKADRNKAISKDYGVAQINSQHDENPDKYLSVIANLNKAREIYDKAKGFSPWYAYTKGKYLEFL